MSLTGEEALAKVMASWQGRAVWSTQNNHTTMGMILLLGLGHHPPRPPFLLGLLTILPNGELKADRYVDRQGHIWGGPVIGTVDQTIEYFHRLADARKFNDDERRELFETIRRAIGIDQRPEKDRGLG